MFCKHHLMFDLDQYLENDILCMFYTSDPENLEGWEGEENEGEIKEEETNNS